MFDYPEWIVPVILILFVLCLVVVAVGADYITNRISCETKTAQIGFDHRYTFWGGCLIEVRPGQWIPLESYYFKQE